MKLTFVKHLVIFLSAVFITILFGFASGQFIPYNSPAFAGWAAMLAALGAVGSFFLLVYQHFTVKDSSRFINIVKSNTTIMLTAFTGLVFLSIVFDIGNVLINMSNPASPNIGASMIDIGDLATWVAAFGTVSTLGFAIKQNNQLREEQIKEREDRIVEEAKQRTELNEERNKREEHEHKQQEMWQEQRKLQTAQVYQAHRAEFLTLLKQLETTYSGLLRFTHKEALYQAIFPNNSFSNCSFSATSETEGLNPTLSKIYSLYDKNTANFNSAHSKIVGVLTALQLEVIVSEPFGNLIYKGNVKLNIFDMHLIGFAMNDITSKLFKFSGNPPPEGAKYFRHRPEPNPNFTMEGISTYGKPFFPRPMPRGFGHSMLIDLELDRFDTLYALSSFYTLVNSMKLGTLGKDQTILHMLIHLFQENKTGILEFLNNPREQLEYLGRASSWIDKEFPLESLKAMDSNISTQLKDVRNKLLGATLKCRAKFD